MANFLIGFVKFFAEIDMSQSVISPFKGQLVPLSTFQSAPEMTENSRMKTFKYSSINIQDPFVLCHNTAKNVNEKAAISIAKKFKAAAKLCSSDTFWSTGECVRSLFSQFLFMAFCLAEDGSAGIFHLLRSSSGKSPVKEGQQHSLKATETQKVFDLPLCLKTTEVDGDKLLGSLQSVFKDILYLDVDSGTRKHSIGEEDESNQVIMQPQ